MRRSAEDAAQTRRTLLEAALMAFEEKGWRGATFEHISERAGVTRGALHHHFTDKAALLAEALEWGWREHGAEVFQRLDELTEAGRPALARLQALVADYVRRLMDDARFRALASTTVLVAPQALGPSEQKTAALDGWRTRIAAVLTDDPRSPGTLPADTVAGLVLVLLQGFTVTAVTRPTDLPHPDQLDAAAAALVRGLLT